jgi:soluble lytic murein transglycosylase-like protein
MIRTKLFTALAVSMLVVPLAVAAKSIPAAQAKSLADLPPAQTAYTEVITWAMGYRSIDEAKQSRANYNDVQQRLERSAYRYGIRVEWAMAVIAAESRLAPSISYGRSDSWRVYQESTGKVLSEHPNALTDLDTALSSLSASMEKHPTSVDAVLKDYWCGPDGKANADSYATFSEVSKRQPYSEYFDDLPAWSGRAEPRSSDGFKSKLGTRPLTSAELVYYKGHEEAYAAQVRKFNKRLTEAEARTIARSILSYCAKTDWEVDPRLIMAIVAAESAFRPDAVSKAGALGLGQLMPATARSYGVSKPFDPCQNLYGCVKYVEREQHRWGKGLDKVDLILAAYNAGPGAVKKYQGVPPHKETKNYVKTVKKYYNNFRKGS